MNELRAKGTLKFNPRTFGQGNVGIVVQIEGESGGTDMTCWAEDAPDAAEALASCGEGSKVTILGKLVRKKDKQFAKVKDGAIVAGDVWVMGVSVLKVRVDKPAAPPPPRNEPPPSGDDSLPF